MNCEFKSVKLLYLINCMSMLIIANEMYHEMLRDFLHFSTSDLKAYSKALINVMDRRNAL